MIFLELQLFTGWKNRVLITMVVQYRKKVGLKTGGIKRYSEFKNK